MSDPIQIGDFRIERQIGAGGMGVVYLATQMSLNRKVALKVLGQSITRHSSKARFQREAQAVAKLNHPNIASIYFVGQDARLCYMAMEYIEGVSLRECIERLAQTTKPDSSIDDFVYQPDIEACAERFDQTVVTQGHVTWNGINPYISPQAKQAILSESHVRRCVEIVRDVALALQHAHDQGVIHRDLKPDNLMLGRDGRVRVIDFGVARFFEDATLTQTGVLVGTPIYMSPEQVTGRIELDARTDVYSLGIVLYEVLVLRQPISATCREGVLREIVLKPLRPVSELNSRVPETVQRVVHKAASKDPDDRYQTARDFADDLERYLIGQPVVATRYRYVADEWEIRSCRPVIVVIASMVFGGGACVSLLMLLPYTIALVTRITEGKVDFPLQIFVLILLLNSPFAAFPRLLGAWALWRAHRWARKVVLAAITYEAIVLLLGELFWVVFLDRILGWLTFAVWFPGSSLIVGIFGIAVLWSKKAHYWFKFARRVRSDEELHS